MLQLKRRFVYFNQMMMNTRRKKVAYLSVVMFAVYFFGVPKKYDATFSAYVPEEEPGVVWDFLADFSNIKKLNPTITDFTITADRNMGFEHWEYGVRYTEYLSNLPFIQNVADAVVKVYRTPEAYVVESNHTTCFFGKFVCLNSWSNFKCNRAESGPRFKYTYVREEILYECPRFSFLFCRSEVMFQRRAIFNNLIHIFEKKRQQKQQRAMYFSYFSTAITRR